MAEGGIAKPRLRIRGIPVLLYHRVLPKADSLTDKYCVRSSELQRQFAFLNDRHYEALSIPQLAEGSACGDRKAAVGAVNQVALTFDDGYDSDYRYAFPLLMESGLKATFFVNTGLVGQRGYLSWAEIREMQQAGMSFGSHGHNHVVHSRLSPAAGIEQLRISRDLLEQNLGQTVDCFSAPYGLVDRDLIRRAERCGFRTVCNSHNWMVRPGQRLIGRLTIYHDTRFRQFQSLIAGAILPLLRRSAREIALAIPRRILLRWCPQRLGALSVEEIA
jgi:peptidoglycan/xylan/chitin deacetylase (PgdA/CDA1 family)